MGYFFAPKPNFWVGSDRILLLQTPKERTQYYISPKRLKKIQNTALFITGGLSKYMPITSAILLLTMLGIATIYVMMVNCLIYYFM
jgi:uncharacterized membrane protein YdcZ (DUF606 family)